MARRARPEKQAPGGNGGVIRRVLGTGLIQAEDVARVLGASRRSVARWRAGGTLPKRAAEERLLELEAVLGLLARVLRGGPAGQWLRRPNPSFGYEKPLDLIARGDYRSVIGELLVLAEGVTA